MPLIYVRPDGRVLLESSFYPVITRNGMPLGLRWNIPTGKKFLSCHHQEWYATGKAMLVYVNSEGFLSCHHQEWYATDRSSFAGFAGFRLFLSCHHQEWYATFSGMDAFAMVVLFLSCHHQEWYATEDRIFSMNSA